MKGDEMGILWNTDVDARCCPGEILELGPDGKETGRSVLIQTDWDYPSVASSFGWSLTSVQAARRDAQFERFSITLPREAIDDCHHQGDCGPDVEAWATDIDRPDDCTPEALAAELREYGAWDDAELADDSANWERIIWIAAGNLKEEPCEHDGTEGTVDCECGVTVAEFLSAAYDWLVNNDGLTAEDPGYFLEQPDD